MIIRDIQTIPIRVPILDEGCATSRIAMTYSDTVIVKVIGEDGTYGVGEACARPMIYGDTLKGVVSILQDEIKPKLIGEDSLSTLKLRAKLQSIKANYCAKAAVDVALHDLNGKQLGLPLCAVLGGPVRESVRLSWTMSGSNANWDSQQEEVRRKLEQGFRSFKFKLAAGVQRDIEFIKLMRSIVTPDTHIYADANGYYTRNDAYTFMKSLEGVIDAVEEPLSIFDNPGRKELAERVNVSILIDESAFTPEEVYRQIRLGAVGWVGIKVARTGVIGSLHIAYMAEAACLPAQICTQVETDIGAAAAVQVAASQRSINLPCELAFYSDNYPVHFLKTPLRIKDGAMEVPMRPGIGADVDWDLVEQYRRPLD